MKYLVYKITNLINGKIYIGCHQTSDVNDGYMGSGKLIKRAIEKYGIENFHKEILHECSSVEKMFEMESTIVNEEFVECLNTYNLKTGGTGGWSHITTEQKQKGGLKTISILRDRLKNDPIFQKQWTEATSKRMTELHELGIIKSPDWSGRKHSEETKIKMSNSHKGKHIGSKNSQYGKVYVYNLEKQKSIRIPIECLEEYLNKGWCKGRKMKFE